MAAKASAQPKEPEVPVHVELAELETKIFGQNVLRDAAGVPMERGHGSHFQRMQAADRTHYLMLAATARADQMNQLATSLADLSEKLMADQKSARISAEKAAIDAAAAQIIISNANDKILALTKELAAAKAQKEK